MPRLTGSPLPVLFFPPPPPLPTAARKNKKLMKIKVQQPSVPSEPVGNLPVPVIPRCMPQLVPTMLSVLKAIEPEIIYSGYDSTLPDTSSRLMTTLNKLGGQQVISAVKWAKSLPGNQKRKEKGFLSCARCGFIVARSVARKCLCSFSSHIGFYHYRPLIPVGNNNNKKNIKGPV